MCHDAKTEYITLSVIWFLAGKLIEENFGCHVPHSPAFSEVMLLKGRFNV